VTNLGFHRAGFEVDPTGRVDVTEADGEGLVKAVENPAT